MGYVEIYIVKVQLHHDLRTNVKLEDKLEGDVPCSLSQNKPET